MASPEFSTLTFLDTYCTIYQGCRRDRLIRDQDQDLKIFPRPRPRRLDFGFDTETGKFQNQDQNEEKWRHH